MLFVIVSALAIAAGEPETYALDNGLRVILDPQRGVGSIHMCVEYKAGWAHDAPDSAGLNALAYWLLMAPQGNLGERSAGDVLVSHGITPRPAMQTQLATRFCAYLPPQELGAALWVESHRAGVLREPIKDETFVKARMAAVATPPFGGYTDAFPVERKRAATLWNQLLPDGHPMRIRAGASSALTEEAVHALAPSYSASNAVLILVGDLPKNVRQLVHDHWDGAPKEVVAPAPPHGLPDASVSIESANKLLTVWAFVPDEERERELGDVVAELLGTSSRAFFTASSDDLHDVTIFKVEVASSKGDQTTQDRKRILEERIREVRNSGNEDAIQRAMHRLAFRREWREQSYGMRAHANLHFWWNNHEPVSPWRAGQRYAFTAADVAHFIDKHLKNVPEPAAHGQVAAR